MPTAGVESQAFRIARSQKDADFCITRQHRRSVAEGFFWYFPVISDQANGLQHRLRKTKFGSLAILGVCNSNRIAHRGSIARFGPLRTVTMCCQPIALHGVGLRICMTVWMCAQHCGKTVHPQTQRDSHPRHWEQHKLPPRHKIGENS